MLPEEEGEDIQNESSQHLRLAVLCLLSLVTEEQVEPIKEVMEKMAAIHPSVVFVVLLVAEVELELG